jgi:hypothetical protein
MSITQALALRCELVHLLTKVHPQERAKIIRINRKISSLDSYLKSAPPLMEPIPARAR